MSKETTMPKTAPTPTPDELRQQADQLDQQAHALRLELQRQAQEADARRLERQRAFDEQQVAGYSRAALEADVDQAKAALDAALADNPLVLALADYLSALRRRSHAVHEHSSALSRLGRPTGSPQVGATELSNLDDYVLPAAERIASERIAREQADLYARRDAAGDDPKENR